jgi:L-threonylcarbamoyladenylate synthase
MKIPLEQAISLLKDEKVVAIPTETVYGLASPYHSEKGIESVFRLKNRPMNNPLIIHIAKLEDLNDITGPLTDEAKSLAEAFWPGPLTLVLPLKKNHPCHPLVTAGLKTVAVRMPDHAATLKLIEATGPLVAPSANASGYPSSTKMSHVERDFGIDFPIMEGDMPSFGLESTILAYHESSWVIAREGALTPSDLTKVLGYSPKHFVEKARPICPGQHYKHYSPKAVLSLKSYIELKDCEGIVLGYTERNYPKAKKVVYLGSLSEPMSIQKNLYTTLRLLDLENILEAYIDIDLPEDERLSIIKRRIQKAAAK